MWLSLVAPLGGKAISVKAFEAGTVVVVVVIPGGSETVVDVVVVVGVLEAASVVAGTSLRVLKPGPQLL
jgi:hypothetical protein